MTDEQFKQIINGQRRIEVYLNWIFNLVLLVFLMTVLLPAIAPIMKHFGMWNLLGLPDWMTS